MTRLQLVAPPASVFAAAGVPAGVASLTARLAAGCWTPLHVDPVDERFTAVAGVLTVHVGAETVELAPGEEVTVPARTPHTLCAWGGPAVFTAERAVASQARYLDVLAAAAPPASEAAWRDDPALPGLGAAAAVNGIRLLGPPGALPC